MSILEVYRQLKNESETPKDHWGLWCSQKKTPHDKEKIIIESILTQHTNWKNVEKAYSELEKSGKDSFEALAQIGQKELETLIKSSGFYTSKSRYLIALSKFFAENGGVGEVQKEDVYSLREQLLLLPGIGEETADDILLYGLEKPIFVIDEYTRRLVRKHKLARKLDYQHLQKLFFDGLAKEKELVKVCQDFHAHIVHWGKTKSLVYARVTRSRNNKKKTTDSKRKGS